jgi:pimeloyl-ACP methyl ester carboxylesterase
MGRACCCCAAALACPTTSRTSRTSSARAGTSPGYQQRGLAPSTEAAPFTVSRHVADPRSVLEALGWERAYAVGHSWGGHLALHLGLAIPTRIAGVLAVDPLGGVGAGGFERFGADLAARTPATDREGAEALDQEGHARSRQRRGHARKPGAVLARLPRAP